MRSVLNYSDIQQSLSQFQHWLQTNGQASHDPYNLWSSRYGIWAKGLFHKSALLGAAAVTPIFLADIFAPSLFRRGMAKHRYPIADAHCILAYCELARDHQDDRYLRQAKQLGQELLTQSLGASHSGHCWGYPFDWMSKNGLWKSSTPLMTTTPYCFEAYLALYDLTQNPDYQRIAQSIAQFALNDINEQVVSAHSAAASYSPIDQSKVINANAYRAMVLCEAASRFGSRTMLETALRNLNFVVESQQEDGSWWYAAGNESDLFVDNFHSCLVLKNLVKVNYRLGFHEVWDSIEKGYEFYLSTLIDAKGRTRPFAKSRRIALVSREIYDMAEGISLGLLIHRCFPQLRDRNNLRSRALSCAQELATQLVKEFQRSDGHFVTKEHFGFIQNTTPYIRWAQAQCFYALSQLSCFHSRGSAKTSGYASIINSAASTSREFVAS